VMGWDVGRLQVGCCFDDGKFFFFDELGDERFVI
jgi:hypothetical protein